MNYVSGAFWCAVGLVSVGVWVYLALFRSAFWLLRERLRAAKGFGEAATSVSVVIPARDEEALIGRAVRSLRAQRFGGPFHIVVANDESSDSTAAEARTAGAEVVAVRPRPTGWKGKVWAVSEGICNSNPTADY